MIGLKIGQRRDVRGNVMTFQRRGFPTSRRSGKHRDVPENSNKQRRNVGYQRRDVPERCTNQRRDVPENSNKQRRDVGYQRRNVLERCTNQRRDVPEND